MSESPFSLSLRQPTPVSTHRFAKQTQFIRRFGNGTDPESGFTAPLTALDMSEPGQSRPVPDQCARLGQILRYCNENVPVPIRIGSQTFITSRRVACRRTKLFRILTFQDEIPSIPTRNDRHWFVDADPAIFPHILAYLRTGDMPLFFDAVRGHDITMYHNLEREARYFELPDLLAYLHDGQYLRHARIEFEFEYHQRQRYNYWVNALDVTVTALGPSGDDSHNFGQGQNGYLVRTKRVRYDRYP